MRYLPREVDSQFLVRILKNEASSEEVEFFEDWLQESDDHKEVFANTAWMWDRMAEARTPPDPAPEYLWLNVEQRVVSPEQTKEASGQNENSASPGYATRFSDLFLSWRENFLLRFTSYVLAPLSLVFIVYGIFKLYESASPAKKQDVAEETLPVVMMKEIVTGRGQRATVPLADGTIVYLNADSRLRFPRHFSVSSRELELTGEAYFAVKHDALRPFRVTTGEAITEVKGTEFNVRYRNEKLNVVVSKGAVRLYDRRRTKEVDLRKGQLASYSNVIGFSEPRKVDVRQYVAWRQNKLSFVKTPLRDVMAEIELFYNVRVVFKTNLFRQNTLTGYFAVDSLDEVLSNIAVAMDVRIKRDGQTIVVY